MKKQVVVIHGGSSAFPTYEDFLNNLKTKPIYIDKFKGGGDWKSRLPQSLGDEYEVIYPGMPNKENARYPEWKIWFERFIPFIEHGVILVGHSLGGIFLARYLSEEEFPKKINGVFLVAAPFEMRGKGETQRVVSEFVLPSSLEKFEKQAGKIFLYHSKDDPIVNIDELEKYRNLLPNATVRIFEDRKHQNQEQFPEIVKDIKSL
ncbi:MAG TPA: alpha/beta hydrolase [Candidatus Paceibacterota bacterium]|nr:alpha/beta hydrolase [Candidatus Paceibacterota bacterium]